mmetsp:Transcript_254/g.540  ORF Transcript_254/g.540 Transcript_254/m.540 type:complete len:98 (+) Transcript_254:4108-4401(+)
MPLLQTERTFVVMKIPLLHQVTSYSSWFLVKVHPFCSGGGGGRVNGFTDASSVPLWKVNAVSRLGRRESTHSMVICLCMVEGNRLNYLFVEVEEANK